MDRWNKYYYDIVNVIASNSKCFSRQIGSILVKDKSILATGYNGPARGLPRCDSTTLSYKGEIEYYPREDGVCPRKALGYESGDGLHLCMAEHSERNTIANAARHGVKTAGTTIYMSCPIPCKNCLTLLINAGVMNIVCDGFLLYDDQSEFIIRKSGLVVKDFEGNTF